MNQNLKASEHSKITGYSMFCWIFAGAIALLSIFPLFWMAMAGFKPEKEVLATPLKFLPTVWTTESFIKLFSDKRNPFWASMGSTAWVSIIACLSSIVVNSCAAYVYSRLEFRFKKLLWRLTIFAMYVPGITILITSFVLVSEMNILNTYTVLIVPGLASAGSIFFFRQFFLNMPVALEEAALIDGASRFRIFISIFVPSSLPPYIFMGVGAFLGYWNSFLWPTLTISDTKMFQIMQIIRSYNTVYASKQGIVMAGSLIAAIPPILLFLIFQRYFLRGVLISGIK